MNFTSPAGKRSDARRNRDAILEATMVILHERPSASIAEIAVAARVSRGTVYAHFASRRELVYLASRRASAAVRTEFAALSSERPAAESLDELVAASWRVLSRFATLAVAKDEPLGQFHEMLRHGLGDGSFRSDQSIEWLVASIFAILQAGAAKILDGRVSEQQGVDEMAATIRAILGAVP